MTAERGRECDCWPQVIRCAHLEGMVVRLADETLTRDLPMHTKITGFVVHGPSVLVQCNCSVNHTVFDDAYESIAFLKDSGEAEAEFQRRAAVLLGRDDDG